MRDRIPTYVIDFRLKNSNISSTPCEWKTKVYGKPTKDNLAEYAKRYNDSVKPDGVNSHLGEDHEAIWLGIRKNDPNACYIYVWNEGK